MKLLTIGVDIFLERRKTRLHVGVFTKKEKTFVFTYDDYYLRAKNVIPLGPEFPLTKKEFKSDTLFPSLDDRIPSRQNPAFPEYCDAMGIDSKEKDPIILLSTIGKRGASSFVFEPIYEHSFTAQDVIEFRKSLGFTTREFAHVFDVALSSLNILETKQKSGKDLLKRLEIIVRFPEVALYFLFLNGGALPQNKWQNAASILKAKKNIHK